MWIFEDFKSLYNQFKLKGQTGITHAPTAVVETNSELQVTAVLKQHLKNNFLINYKKQPKQGAGSTVERSK